MWFKRKRKSPPSDRPENKSAPSSAPRGNDHSIEASLSKARGILHRDGAAKALEYLRDSPYVGSEPVVRMMHALVWNNQHDLPKELLEEPFLDPIWCQCTVCEYTWLISPLLSQVGQYRTQNAGIVCSSCGRVLCPKCATAADANCPCGGSFSNICHPNGRKHREHSTVESEEWNWLPPPPDIPIESAKDLHLYFGFEGRVPIGVDPSFPSVQTASTDDHLGWAETLVDAGLFYQAQQQFDLLKESGASSARANWLRARLELVRLRNASERSMRHLDTDLGIPEWWKSPEKIKRWLDDATKQSPKFGPAWLTAAQVYLDPACGQDFARALQCAQCAQARIGETPAVLLALGQALRGSGRALEAVAVLRRIPARYLFSWDNIPGDDSERLLRYLKDDHNISWVESAEIRKSDDSKAVRIFKDENSAEIRIEEEKVTLEISDARIHDLKVKQENGKTNIYEESTQALEDLKLAELEARCQFEPIDVKAHLRLGRWCLRNNQRDRARKIFTRLLKQTPDCAEGYYGLAQLVFTDYGKEVTERYTESHRLSHEALKRNQDFGLAYELLGTIFGNLRSGMEKVDFPLRDPIDCYRHAIELDPTCDVALCSVAEDYIERGQLQPAIEFLERAAKLDTNFSSVYFILAVVYRGTRQFWNEDWARHKAKELSPDTELTSEYENKILQLCGFEY